MARIDSAAGFLLAAATFVLTVAHVAYYFPRVVDDLFISLRYAENLAHGRGAVFNPGERVEGVSSPLWMFLQSFGFVLGFEGITWTKALGCASLLALEYGLFRLARDVFGIRGSLAVVPSLACAASSYVVNWAVLGLETPLHLAMLVLAPVAVHRSIEAAMPRGRAVAVLVLVALGTTRPESALYLAACAVSTLVSRRSGKSWAELARQAASVFVPAFVVLGALVLARRAYYGFFVPNTYFVKGADLGFDTERLAPLWSNGASQPEALLLTGGSALLVYYGVRARAVAAPLSLLACLYFTATVRLDWMPSLRHLLPVTVLAPLGWVCLADDLRSRRWRELRVASIAPLAVVLVGSARIAQIDNRYSPEERKWRRGWVVPKARERWQETVLAYRRVEPPRVARKPRYGMGQITQVWGVLETSAAPVEDSWFVGRDIGIVGYVTGVRVFDTAGLFTPAVSHSAAFTRRHVVTDDLIRRAMALRPIAGEIYEGWEAALGRHPELLRGYRIRTGTRRTPVAWIATDRPPPTPQRVIERYEAMVAKFPRAYHLHTLYGEPVGADVERRLRIVREEAARARSR